MSQAMRTLRRRLDWQLADVTALVDETARVRTVELEAPGWAGHLPGQHVDVRLTAEDGYQAQRSYSIATPAERSRLAITVERIDSGEVSPYLAGELRPGDKLELRGPIGGYFVWEPSRGGPLLLAAGGSGIVPLMAMIRERVAMRSWVSIRLLASSRSLDDIIYRSELEAISRDEMGVEIIHTLTRSQPPEWPGYDRRVDREMLAEVGWPPTDGPLCYVCGPTGFVEAVASALVELGHPPEMVRTERFGPTGDPR
jgi:ferredoxin-NADP reductase